MSKKKINLLVETKKNSMLITKSDLNAEQVVQLIQYLTEQLEKASGIDHDEILEDLMYNEEANKKDNKNG